MDLDSLRWADDLCQLFRRPARNIARDPPQRRRIRADGGPRLPPRRPADHRDRGGPASLVDRPGLRRGRPGQVHVWHRRLPAHAHGRPDRPLAQRAGDDPRRHAEGRAAAIRPGGERLRRGCRGAMVPRRPQGHRRLVRDQPAVARVGPIHGRDLRPRPDRPGRPPLASGGPGDDLRPDAAPPRSRTSPARRSKGWPARSPT